MGIVLVTAADGPSELLGICLLKQTRRAHDSSLSSLSFDDTPKQRLYKEEATATAKKRQRWHMRNCSPLCTVLAPNVGKSLMARTPGAHFLVEAESTGEEAGCVMCVRSVFELVLSTVLAMKIVSCSPSVRDAAEAP